MAPSCCDRLARRAEPLEDLARASRRCRRDRSTMLTGGRSPGCAGSPMPSISISTTSPGDRLPTPEGVPVEITSPGSSVMCCVTNAMSVGDVEDQIRGGRVLLDRAVDPGGDPEVRADRGPRRSSARSGRTCRTPWPGSTASSFFWRSRTVTSLMQVKPRTTSSALVARDPPRALADHHPELPLVVDPVVPGGALDRASRRGEAPSGASKTSAAPRAAPFPSRRRGPDN